jgi:hypothetical protein
MARVAAAKAVLAEAREAEESGRASAAKQTMPGLLIVLESRGERPAEHRLGAARSVERIAYDPAPPHDEATEVILGVAGVAATSK